MHLFHSADAYWTRLPQSLASREKGDSIVLTLAKPGPMDLTIKGVSDERTSVIRVGLTSEQPILPKYTFITPSLGFSFISYSQAPALPFQFDALTFKLSYLHRFELSRWDLAANGFITALPLGQDPNGNTLRFLGLNLRAGYHLLANSKSSWDLALLGGIYYTTMFVSPGSYGFQNATGPQLYPALSYSFGPRLTLGIYGKYSPVTNGLSFLALSNRELAEGVWMAWTLRSGHPISLTLDHSDFYLDFGAGTIIDYASSTLGLGYGF